MKISVVNKVGSFAINMGQSGISFAFNLGQICALIAGRGVYESEPLQLAGEFQY